MTTGNSIPVQTTIEPSPAGEGFWLVQHGQYAEHSVLAGQPYRQLAKFCSTLEAAILENPEAQVLNYSTRDPFGGPILSSVAPNWFDPADAGERWDDDY